VRNELLRVPRWRAFARLCENEEKFYIVLSTKKIDNALSNLVDIGKNLSLAISSQSYSFREPSCCWSKFVVALVVVGKK
jgi:hypothetical protein